MTPLSKCHKQWRKPSKGQANRVSAGRGRGMGAYQTNFSQPWCELSFCNSAIPLFNFRRTQKAKNSKCGLHPGSTIKTRRFSPAQTFGSSALTPFIFLLCVTNLHKEFNAKPPWTCDYKVLPSANVIKQQLVIQVHCSYYACCTCPS